jgi:tetratricopeptide (TPR) repeat protein
MGLAVGSRVGGVLLYAYFRFFVAAYYMFVNQPKEYFSKKNQPILNRMIVRYLLIVLGAFIVTIPLWPYIMGAPIKNTIQAFKDMSHYVVSLRQNFGGIMYWSDSLPRTYTPRFMLMSIPIAVILGTIIYLVTGGLKKKNRFITFMLYFAFVFPIFWIMYSRANVYGGWRHAMFVYPIMVVTAGLGFDALIDLVKQKYAKIALTALPFMMLITPLSHIIRNHPYEYVYFNEFVGGVKGVYGNYELDYYFHSLREASQWVKDNATKDAKTTGDKIKVGAWLIPPVNYFFRNDTAKFEVVFTRYYERGSSDWDYSIFVNTGVGPEQLKNGTWPPKSTVHTINVDGKPICAILKRISKDDFYASQYKAKAEDTKDSASVRFANMLKAEELFKKSLVDEPNNEYSLMSLTELYMNRGSLDSANLYIDQLLKIYPSYESALNMKGWIGIQLFDKKKDTKALEESRVAFEKSFKVNFKFAYGYYGLAMVYIRMNNLVKAIDVLEEALKVNPGFQQGAELLNQLKNATAQQGGM